MTRLVSVDIEEYVRTLDTISRVIHPRITRHVLPMARHVGPYGAPYWSVWRSGCRNIERHTDDHHRPHPRTPLVTYSNIAEDEKKADSARAPIGYDSARMTVTRGATRRAHKKGGALRLLP